MIAGIILIIVAAIFVLVLPFWYTKIIGLICFFCGVVLFLRGCKTFIFDLIDHIKGTGSNKATPKRDKNATPPWEE